MKFVSALPQALLLSLTLAASVLPASAQRYQLTDLGVIPGQQNSRGFALNNKAMVAGASEFFASRYRNGIQENLGTLPGGTTSVGRAINSRGAVAGYSLFANGGAIQQAALFENGTVTGLGTLPNSGNYSFGRGINDAKEIVGYTAFNSSTNSTRAFIWDAVNGMRDIGTLGGAYARALGINNASEVTGTANVPFGTGNYHAFIWDAVNGMRDIPPIAGTTASGNAINALGHVAGTSTINDFDNRTHAFLYNGTQTLDLGSLGGDDFYSDRSEAFGINGRDVVVGSTYLPYEGGGLYQVAFVYRKREMLNLETLVDASGADYRLYTGLAINDGGQIVVSAIKISTNEIRAVLLTPIQIVKPVKSR